MSPSLMRSAIQASANCFATSVCDCSTSRPVKIQGAASAPERIRKADPPNSNWLLLARLISVAMRVGGIVEEVAIQGKNAMRPE